jgi:hypothetical protein
MSLAQLAAGAMALAKSQAPATQPASIADLAGQAVELAKSYTKLAKSEDGDEDDADPAELTDAEVQEADDKQAVKDLQNDGMPTDEAKTSVYGDDAAGDDGDDETEDFGKSLAILSAQGRVGEYRDILARREAGKKQAEIAKSRAGAALPELPSMNFRPSPDCDPMSIRIAPEAKEVGYLALGFASGSGLYNS